LIYISYRSTSNKDLSICPCFHSNSS